MSKGKRLVLALVLLVTFCTVAIAASPKVDSILQEHDVLVPFFLPGLAGALFLWYHALQKQKWPQAAGEPP